MKLFVADSRETGHTSPADYHWCDSGEILTFAQFQTEDNRKGNEIYMCGIQSRQGTTHIRVKELDIPEAYVLELLTESVEKSMCCTVHTNGSYSVDLGEGWKKGFNINDLLKELTEKSGAFNDGDKVKCKGRILSLSLPPTQS